MKGRKWLIVLAGAVVAVLLLRGFLFTSFIIPSSGMENALYQGDHIIVNKWSYGLRLPCMQLLSYHRWRSRTVKAGDIVVFNNPANTSQPVIDKREIFISRCIATPGEELMVDSKYNPVASGEKIGPDRKKLYTYPKAKEEIMVLLLYSQGLTDNQLMGQGEEENVRSFSRYEMYLLEQSSIDISWLKPQQETSNDNLRTITIPAIGVPVKIDRWNATLYRNTLLLHEGIQADVRNDSLFVNGKPVNEYVFTKDYYWMSANNSLNLADSRLFGLVPHDHLIGRASFVWFSKEPHTGLFNGYRWSRFFLRHF